jgi:membrane protein implicated in regulation of membrane protease activity
MEQAVGVVLAFAALLAPESFATQSAVAALLLASLLLPFSLELEPHVVLVEESL